MEKKLPFLLGGRPDGTTSSPPSTDRLMTIFSNQQDVKIENKIFEEIQFLRKIATNNNKSNQKTTNNQLSLKNIKPDSNQNRIKELQAFTEDKPVNTTIDSKQFYSDFTELIILLRGSEGERKRQRKESYNLKDDLKAFVKQNNTFMKEISALLNKKQEAVTAGGVQVNTVDTNRELLATAIADKIVSGLGPYFDALLNKLGNITGGPDIDINRKPKTAPTGPLPERGPAKRKKSPAQVPGVLGFLTKLNLLVTAGLIGYNVYEGQGDEATRENFDLEDNQIPTTAQKATSGVANAISGLTFGIADTKKTAQYLGKVFGVESTAPYVTAGSVEPMPTGNDRQNAIRRKEWMEKYGDTHNPDGSSKMNKQTIPGAQSIQPGTSTAGGGRGDIGYPYVLKEEGVEVISSPSTLTKRLENVEEEFDNLLEEIEKNSKVFSKSEISTNFISNNDIKYLPARATPDNNEDSLDKWLDGRTVYG
jgi:hypothetical protein